MIPTFCLREEPLEPTAVVAVGDVAARLAARLARGPAGQLAALTFIHTPRVLVALGPSEQLPWVPGVIYLGHEPGVPGLLLPTTKRTSVSAALVEKAVRRVTMQPDGPLALVTLELVVPLIRARRLDADAFRPPEPPP
jgi:hypothetical protein